MRFREDVIRAIQIPLVAVALLIFTANAALALTLIFEWKGMGKSAVFTIPAKLSTWRAAWSCDASSDVKIALIDVDDGRVVDYLGASFRGERLLSGKGRFQWDARGDFCEVTVTTLK